LQNPGRFICQIPMLNDGAPLSSLGPRLYTNHEDPYPTVLAVPNGIPEKDLSVTERLVASQGRHMHCTVKVCVTVGAVRGSLAETLRLRDSTDACEFYAAVLRLCRDAGVFLSWVARCTNGIEVHERPHIFIVPPKVSEGLDMWSVAMAASYGSPTNSQGYTSYCEACGLAAITW
jgi:hypothetical protein